MASAASSLLTAVDPKLFPLRNIGDVVNFFRKCLENQKTDPDLTLLSIVGGYIELSLTTGNAITAATSAESTEQTSSTLNSRTTGASSKNICNRFPIVTHEVVIGLYKKFQSILSVVEKPKAGGRNANRDVIKKVSDVIWNSLIRSSYKDRAHLQNLYSYLSANKLDCFGVALAVVAGCQLLGYKDVHLAISEDHAWVVFGKNQIETIEVTWHGKGSEDKRGQDIKPGIESGSWLYLSGIPVVCDRYMEVAAIVCAINISLTAYTDCLEVAELQQRLLWLLYDMGHLRKYPMALGNLGELEEVSPTSQRITCEELYRQAIESACDNYKNHHVYPYTYQGNYYYRLSKYREALRSWANAADVIRLYTYNCRDDEEIYKELLDIANEMIPHVMKTESSGHSARSILRDSECFANLLRFYDGICQWEEYSLTPILHIGWAKPLVNTISKFDYDVRSQVVINVPDEFQNISTNKHMIETKEAKRNNNEQIPNFEKTFNNNNNSIKKDEVASSCQQRKSKIPTTLADLTAACGEKILNPDFLLQGGGQPFATVEQKQISQSDEASATLNTIKTDQPEIGVKSTTDSAKKRILSPETVSVSSINATDNTASHEEDPFEFMFKRPIITLYSQKMTGLKNLLLAEKLNTHAISLQVTAQSVASKKVRGIDKSMICQASGSVDNADSVTTRPKRTRRD